MFSLVAKRWGGWKEGELTDTRDAGNFCNEEPDLRAELDGLEEVRRVANLLVVHVGNDVAENKISIAIVVRLAQIARRAAPVNLVHKGPLDVQGGQDAVGRQGDAQRRPDGPPARPLVPEWLYRTCSYIIEFDFSAGFLE